MFDDFVSEVKELFDSRGIVRKYSGEPYWKHLENVTDNVQKFLKEESFDVWTIEHMNFHVPLRFIAYGHDVFEDIYNSYEFKSFNKYENPPECTWIYSGIRYLTDVYTKNNYPYLNRTQRKLLEAQRLSKIPFYAMYIKLADLYDNTNDIVKHDEGFAIEYIKEKAVILKLMHHHNFYIGKTKLYNVCYEQAQIYASHLKIKNIVF